MPKDVVEITVLLASPGDVVRERAAVRNAVEEVNRTSGEHDGFRLNVKGWETHTRPAATKKGRPQDAIFEQIGPYDIFLGIMWTRVGTPTGKAASGTIEEYEHARRQWSRRRKYKPSVMFYFRSRVATEIDRLDPEQLKQVKLFKQRVFKDGLAREYGTVRAFEGMMREHLTLEARAVLKRYMDDHKDSRKAGRRSAPSPRVRQRDKQARDGRDKADFTPQPNSSGSKARSKTKASPSRSDNPARRSKLDIPEVAKKLTETDREKFAQKALTRALKEFRSAAKEFNGQHPHATITVRQEGQNAFTVRGAANGEESAPHRVRLEQAWNGWVILHEVGQLGFYGGEPHYYSSGRITIIDDGYTAKYQSELEAFPNGQRQTDLTIDVARLLWTKFVNSFRRGGKL